DGGPASSAGFALPTGLEFDRGDLYIIDADADRIRVVFDCVEVGAPALISPSQGSSGVATAPVLRWGGVRGALRYDLLLDTASPPARIVAADVETTVHAPSNLQPLTTYYWKVVARGDPFCVPFSTASSEIRSFTTRADCTVPGEP
ncbi:MAG TPA: hypothetical protein VM534_11035, partial [Thermoanaerobaculia bacterium]|nr:hypothetical protein [Thermoanaerobaculia bacterium]